MCIKESAKIKILQMILSTQSIVMVWAHMATSGSGTFIFTDDISDEGRIEKYTDIFRHEKIWSSRV